MHTEQIDNFELGFPLSHDRTAWIKNMGGGNFSVIRDLAIEVGGFDQRFYRVAYREDSDFLFRFYTRYRCLAKYVPEASLVHLASLSGGCESRRAAFDPLACSGSVGEHYFTLKNMGVSQALCNFATHTARTCGRFAMYRPLFLPLIGFREIVAFTVATLQVLPGRALLAPIPKPNCCD